MVIFPKILSFIISLLYPPVCPVCGKILGKEDRSVSNPYICSICYEKISFPSEPRCVNCSRPLFDEREELCFSCGKQKLFFDRSTALMMHDEVSKKILYDLKYYNRKDNARMLAFEAVKREGRRIMAWNPDVIIPVPLHRKRELERGYNQAGLLAEHLCAFLSRYSGSPGKTPDTIYRDNLSGRAERGPEIMTDSSYLIRVRRTKAQKELSGEQRKENIRGAFAVDYRQQPDKYAGKTILLVDDIYTSGATLSECARVLKQHGAKNVYCLTFGIG